MFMTIRFAKSEDRDQVLKLLDELREAVRREDGQEGDADEAQRVGSEIFEEVVSRKDTKVFVAEEGGRLVGLITFYILPEIRHGGYRGHIEEFVVSKELRGQGIGSKLFDAVKEYCKENNIKVIKLDSGLRLIDSHRFYEKNGGKFTEKMFRFDID